jgi:unsaturated rhamnogalacturonyl hydrolase
VNISCNTRKVFTPLPFVISVIKESAEDLEIVSLDWNDVINRIGDVDPSKILIRDLNNDEFLTPAFYDTNSDNMPDKLVFNTHLSLEEPLRPFEIILNEKANSDSDIKKGTLNINNSIIVTFLISGKDYQKKARLDGKWSTTIADSFLKTYPDPSGLEVFEKGIWTYTNGFFTNALCELYNHTGNRKYLEYVKNWLALFLSAEGTIDSNHYEYDKYRLDDILPGRSLLYVYSENKDEKYIVAANDLINQLKNQPRTSEGGYWHKKMYEWQMWLDGVYMSDVYMLQYAQILNKPEYIDEAIKQIELVYKHTHDPKTGLLYHGWDESKNKIWANQETGVSPEFWGRGIGWFMMALVDALDYIPESHPERDTILNIFQELSASIAKYQEKSSGLWYQVPDKANKPGNWRESSCSAMFAYAFAKGYKKGFLDESYFEKAKHAFDGFIKYFIYFDDEGKIYLTSTVKVGTLNFEYSDGSYEYYISVDRRINDFKGISALLYLTMAIEY